MNGTRLFAGDQVVDSANDRLRRSFSSIFWGAMIVATAVHFGTFALWPELSAADVSVRADEIVSVTLPPDVVIPPKPPELSRPAAPVIADVPVDPGITIPKTDFEDHPVAELPKPTQTTKVDVDRGIPFTPYTVAPSVLNANEVIRAMERDYPPLLRDASIGGTVKVYFNIDEDGAVVETKVSESSGHPGLDTAAIKVANVYRFSPALNRDTRVRVWVVIPITFQVR